MPVYDGDLIKGVVGSVAHARLRLLVLPLGRVAVRARMMAADDRRDVGGHGRPEAHASASATSSSTTRCSRTGEPRCASASSPSRAPGAASSTPSKASPSTPPRATRSASSAPTDPASRRCSPPLAGLLAPTSGEILVAEEPKLLGVGATLIAAATGYRNIRLGCLALGMSNAEVDEKIDEIVEFTDIGEAINRPLRTYSSGMRARLHFAIATSVQPRILLIDEALSVGDKAFRAKSAARIDEIVVRRRNADARQPLDGGDRPAVHPGAVDRGRARLSPTVPSTRCSRPTPSPEPLGRVRRTAGDRASSIAASVSGPKPTRPCETATTP